MAFERHTFDLSGPLHLTVVDWKNAHDRRSVAASLVKGTSIIERDRQLNRQGPQALAPRWWEFFHFQLFYEFVDDVDSSIFGAIYEFKPPADGPNNSTQGAPRYVIAFRGNIIKGKSLSRSQDLKLDLRLIWNRLHGSPRCTTAMQVVQNMVIAGGDSNIWLTGHSLGSALAMLTGKNMAKTGIFLDTFLFNPPFISPPIEMIKNEKLKHLIRYSKSLITAGLTKAVNNVKNHHRAESEDKFIALSAWVPCLFVNQADYICSEYIGYFKHRNKMEEIGAGSIERLASQNSIRALCLSAFGKESEPFHLLPSANLITNLSPAPDFKRAHGIQQWWNPNLSFHSKIYHYTL